MQKIATSNANLVAKNIDQVFPNPTTSILNIRMAALPETAMLVTIADANGRVVINSQFPPKSNVLKIDLRRFPHGTYFLRITDLNGSNRGEYKIIKAL